jgi:hypothetical protein
VLHIPFASWNLLQYNLTQLMIFSVSLLSLFRKTSSIQKELLKTSALQIQILPVWTFVLLQSVSLFTSREEPFCFVTAFSKLYDFCSVCVTKSRSLHWKSSHTSICKCELNLLRGEHSYRLFIGVDEPLVNGGKYHDWLNRWTLLQSHVFW